MSGRELKFVKVELVSYQKYVVKENKYLEEFLMQLAQYTESTCVLISTRSYEFSQGKTKIDITYPHR
ncbi:unnamed protein product [Rotaria sordida]|uniref:Uncharacterized protein n=1 Tax=Rotaria sordida TaxID=392033 RepID=A0A814JVN2_9BILA|nr:unnamed protein product [Rotaria sordida]CAF0998571.1 unnamed protein product [Rotaria sordida]CAF1043149.1 unnamed protein product [Rotaria sordida]CAF3618273.1 unnamed protein product [Rotaria sordida]CAF3775123.1 unnamed protein product [Rotaria sordida]